MNKIEAKAFIKANLGYVPYGSLFDLYADEEIVPESLINYYLKVENVDRSIMHITTSLEGAKLFSNALLNYELEGFVTELEESYDDFETINKYFKKFKNYPDKLLKMFNYLHSENLSMLKDFKNNIK